MPTNFRIIRTMCSARVDPEWVLRAFSKGADGVMILGCHPADCHYIGGNYRARRRIALLRMVLEEYGFDPRRLKLEWVSASEGEKFQRVMTDFVEEIRALGEENFFHKDYEETLAETYGLDYEESLVVEGGVPAAASE
jgi:coenzyme F420-reducing hydrogenase delta subunit